MWVRGLKLLADLVKSPHRLSHPMWVRGLKLNNINITFIEITVAPHVGAWIETVTIF